MFISYSIFLFDSFQFLETHFYYVIFYWVGALLNFNGKALFYTYNYSEMNITLILR